MSSQQTDPEYCKLLLEYMAISPFFADLNLGTPNTGGRPAPTRISSFRPSMPPGTKVEGPITTPHAPTTSTFKVSLLDSVPVTPPTPTTGTFKTSFLESVPPTTPSTGIFKVSLLDSVPPPTPSTSIFKTSMPPPAFSSRSPPVPKTEEEIKARDKAWWELEIKSEKHFNRIRNPVADSKSCGGGVSRSKTW